MLRVKPNYFALPEVKCEQYQLQLNADDKVNTTVILERDRFACAACGSRKKLVIHHVDHVPMHNESHNLITLCATCHAVHHKSKVSPFPWLKKLALWRPMSDRLIMKSIKLEARYSPHVYDIYHQS